MLNKQETFLTVFSSLIVMVKLFHHIVDLEMDSGLNVFSNISDAFNGSFVFLEILDDSIPKEQIPFFAEGQASTLEIPLDVSDEMEAMDFFGFLLSNSPDIEKEEICLAISHHPEIIPRLKEQFSQEFWDKRVMIVDFSKKSPLSPSFESISECNSKLIGKNPEKTSCL